MVNIPTTQRQFYDNEKKQSGLSAYSNSLRTPLSVLGSVVDDAQSVKVSAGISDAKNRIKLKDMELRNKYSSNPEDPNFQKELDEYSLQVYNEIKSGINPLYRSIFERKSRELSKMIGQDNDFWKFKQTGINIENNIKKIADGLLIDAYDFGTIGDYVGAERMFDEQMSSILPVAGKYLGVENVKNSIEDMKQLFLRKFSEGMIDENIVDAEKLISDENFSKKIGAENLIGLKNKLKTVKQQMQKKARAAEIKLASENEKRLKDFLKEQRKQYIEKEKRNKKKAEESVKFASDVLSNLEKEKKFKDDESLNYAISVLDDLRTKKIIEDIEDEKNIQKASNILDDLRTKKIIEDIDVNKSVNSAVSVLDKLREKYSENDDDLSVSSRELKIDNAMQKINSIVDAIDIDVITTPADAEYIAQDLINCLYDINYYNKSGSIDDDLFYNSILSIIPGLQKLKLSNGGQMDDKTFDKYIAELEKFYLDKQEEQKLKMYGDLRFLYFGKRNPSLGQMTGKKDFSISGAVGSLFGISNNLDEGLRKSAEEYRQISKNTETKVNYIMRETQMKAFNVAVFDSDFDGARKIFENGQRQIIDVIYPQVHGKEVGDTVIINSTPYEIMGFGSDVYLKIKG